MIPVTDLTELLPVTTTGPEETRAVGRQLAAALPPGSVLAISGSLGAGKTQLVKGIADGLGLDGDAVSSPTFTVIHEYRRGANVLYHVDAYRVRSAAELAELGIEDVLYGDGRCVIEWPERLGALLPPGSLHVRLEHRDGSRRLITTFPAHP